MSTTITIVSDTENLVQLRAGNHTADIQWLPAYEEWSVFFDNKPTTSYIKREDALNEAFRQLSMYTIGEN